MYNEKIMEIFQNPQNVGLIKGADAIGNAHSEFNADMVKFSIRVEDGKIAEIRFKAFGGVALIAICSITTQLLEGKSLEKLQKLDVEKVQSVLGEIEPEQILYFDLVEKALLNTFQNYIKKNK